MSNPQCSAQRLGNCATKIEKEHYVSHGDLKIIGKTFTVVATSLPRRRA